MIFDSKRGNAFQDGLTILIVVFIFATIIILGNKLVGDVNTQIQSSSLNNLTKTNMQEITIEYPDWADSAFLVLLILFWIAGLIASFLIDSHPAFLIVTVILLVFLLILGAVLSNAFDEITSGELSADSFPITNWVMSNLLFVILFISGSIAIVLFGKSRGGV